MHGNYARVRVPQSAKAVDVLVKKNPTNCPDNALFSQEDFEERKSAPVNTLITNNILQALSAAGHYNAYD